MDNAWQVVSEELPSDMPELRNVLPSHNGRYDSLVGNVKTRPSRTTWKAGTFIAESTRVPEGWRRHVHPEGKCYFHHAEFHIVTEKDVRSQAVSIVIKAYYDRIQDLMRIAASSSDWPQDYEIYLEPEENGSCSYYCVSLETRTIFWLEDTDNILNVPYDASEETIALNLQEEYWIHTSYFPVHRNLPREDEEELRAVLVFACTDRMTAAGSTTYLTVDGCFKYLSLLDTAKSNTGPGSRTFLIARLMSTTCRCRNYLLYGQEGARLDRTQDAVEGELPPSPRLYNVIKYVAWPFLFAVHMEHETNLRAVIVDNIVYPESWQTFMSARLHDWEVSAGAALLVMIGNAALSGRGSSWQSMLSVVSGLQSLGSMAIGLSLIRSHRGMEKSDAREAATYLWRRKHGRLTYLPLAIHMALPQALAMWSVLIFALAVLIGFAGSTLPLS